jgi:hypothetical protein
MQAAMVAPPGQTVRPGDRAFTIGCDKGADPTVRMTQITAVNKYQGKPNYTAAGQPIDGRSGGGLFTAEGLLIGICNAADPADDEGLYAGLASIHWQLDQVGQSQIYQRTAQLAATRNATAPSAVVPASATLAIAPSPAPPQLPPQMPMVSLPNTLPTAYEQAAPPTRPATLAAERSPIAVVVDDTEIIFVVRSKRDPAQRSEVFVVDQAPPDLIARITHAAQASGQQRAALARGAAPAARTASANAYPGQPAVVRGQSSDY